MGKWVQVLLSGSNAEVKGIEFHPTNTVAGGYKTVYYNTSTKKLFVSGNLQGLNYVTGPDGDIGPQGQQGVASPNAGLQGISPQGVAGTISDPFEGDVFLTLPSSATGVTRSITIGKDRDSALSSTLARVIFETDPSAGGVGETQLLTGGGSATDGNSVIYHKGTENIVLYVTGSTSNYTTQTSQYVRFSTGNPNPNGETGVGNIQNLVQNGTGNYGVTCSAGESTIIRGLPFPSTGFDTLDRNGVVEGIEYRITHFGSFTGGGPYYMNTFISTSFGNSGITTIFSISGTNITSSVGGSTNTLGIQNLSVSDLILTNANIPYNFSLNILHPSSRTGNSSIEYIGKYNSNNDNLNYPGIRFHTRVLNSAVKVQRESTGLDLFNLTRAGRIFFPQLPSIGLSGYFLTCVNPLSLNSNPSEITAPFFSSKKIKKDIKSSSKELLQGFEKLRPVTYKYKHYEYDKLFAGFIAEECAQANPLFAKYGPNYKIGPHKDFLYNEKPIDDTLVPLDIEPRAIMASAVAKLHQLEEELNYL